MVSAIELNLTKIVKLNQLDHAFVNKFKGACFRLIKFQSLTLFYCVILSKSQSGQILCCTMESKFGFPIYIE